MLGYCRKLLWIFLTLLTIIIFQNEEARAAKTACNDTELWIDRGIVRQAEAAAREPGAETCGVLVVKEFYPEKLNETRASNLIKIAREFVSRTSPLYRPMLRFVIEFNLEPKNIKKNFLEAIKSPAQREFLKRFERGRKKILQDFIARPGKVNPNLAKAGNWHEYFGVKMCVQNLSRDMSRLKKTIDINDSQLDEKNWPSIVNLRKAILLTLKKLTLLQVTL